ncbi:hypothetical protein JL721_7981 [Aureococcus anophagefferens]|nr:hypothetical protein JL721_7981 [Aureococcus anophagefferens]
MPLFRGRRLSFTKKTAGVSPSRVTPEHAAALADPIMQTMRAQLFREEALRAPGDKTYEVPMPRSYDDFVRQASRQRPSFEETSRRRLAAAGGRPRRAATAAAPRRRAAAAAERARRRRSRPAAAAAAARDERRRPEPDDAAASTGPIAREAIATAADDERLGRPRPRPVVARGREAQAARAALLKWHSDKCHAKFGGRIGEADRERVAARITETTRFLQGLLAEDKAR